MYFELLDRAFLLYLAPWGDVMIEHTSDFLFLPSELKMQIRFHVHFLFSRQLILIHHQLILIQHQLILIQPSARDLPLEF